MTLPISSKQNLDQKMIRAVVLVDEGNPEHALEVRNEPLPHLGTGEVQVRIYAAALNHLDIWIRKGLPSVPKPRIMGADAVGLIEAIGPSANEILERRGLAQGDRVIVDPGIACGACRACAAGETSLCPEFCVLGEHRAGTHADVVIIPAINLYAPPPHLDNDSAASLMLTFGTAWRMLFSRAKVQVHERVLIWGASSGVGSAALQLCAAAGIETIATTRNIDKVSVLHELGANHVVITGDGECFGDPVQEFVEQLTDGYGVDVVFDHLGKKAWEPSMLALTRGGRYVTCGASTGPMPPAFITRLFWKQLSMLGSTMASRHDVEDMLKFVKHHKIVPRVDAKFPLEQVVEAHRHLESASQVGKVVLHVNDAT